MIGGCRRIAYALFGRELADRPASPSDRDHERRVVRARLLEPQWNESRFGHRNTGSSVPTSVPDADPQPSHGSIVFDLVTEVSRPTRQRVLRQGLTGDAGTPVPDR